MRNIRIKGPKKNGNENPSCEKTTTHDVHCVMVITRKRMSRTTRAMYVMYDVSHDNVKVSEWVQEIRYNYPPLGRVTYYFTNTVSVLIGLFFYLSFKVLESYYFY